MMYKSPIEIVRELGSQIAQEFDAEVFRAIQKVGVEVDREELLKALHYDRDQYNKGYEDGLKEARRWIPVTERLPEPETEVLILARSGKRHIITTGMYEDGSKNTEDSEWWWETDGFEYDEELDAYIIPEGWWEYKHYNGDDEYNHAIDDVCTHWMPLPEPPREGE